MLYLKLKSDDDFIQITSPDGGEAIIRFEDGGHKGCKLSLEFTGMKILRKKHVMQDLERAHLPKRMPEYMKQPPLKLRRG